MFSKFKYYRVNKDSTIDSIKNILKYENSILLAILFGSFVELDDFRDIDLAIYSINKDLSYYAVLSAKFEESLKIPFDIVPIDELQTKFRYKVLTRGIVIMERIPGLYEAILNQTIDELNLLNKFCSS